MSTRWKIENSHMVNVPKFFEVANFTELRGMVQTIADRKSIRTDRPRIGELSYRYELDERDEAQTVHVYFTDRHDKRRRFMRLRRV